MTRSLLLIGLDDADTRLFQQCADSLKVGIIVASSGVEGMDYAIHQLPLGIVFSTRVKDILPDAFMRMISANPIARNIPIAYLQEFPWQDMDAVKHFAILRKKTDVTAILAMIHAWMKKDTSLIDDANFHMMTKSLFDPLVAIKGLHRMTQDMPIVFFKKKAVIYKDGDAATSIFYIVSGQVKNIISHPDGKQLINNVYSIGDFFGSVPHITDGIYHQTTVAMTDLELRILPKTKYLEELQQNQHFSNAVSTMLAVHMEGIRQQLIHIAYSTVRHKLAKALVMLYYRSPKNVITIKRDDLASLVATAKETIIRTLSDFKDEGLIDIKKSQIFILDEMKLCKINN